MKRLFFLFVSVTFLAVAFVSCDKDSTGNPNPSTYPALQGKYIYSWIHPLDCEENFESYTFDNSNITIREVFFDGCITNSVDRMYSDTSVWWVSTGADTFYTYRKLPRGDTSINILLRYPFEHISPDTFVLDKTYYVRR